MNDNPRKVIIPARLSYANVWEPRKQDDDGPAKYGVSLIIPKTDTKTIAAIEKAIDVATQEGIGKFGGKIPKNLKLPLRDGDVERDDEAYADAMFINASATTAPGIVDRRVQPILNRDEVYSGCYANVSVTFYAYNHPKGGKGVAAGLGNIQKIKDGESLGGRVDASAEFGALEEDDSDFLN